MGELATAGYQYFHFHVIMEGQHSSQMVGGGEGCCAHADP